MPIQLWLCVCINILVYFARLALGNVYSDDGRRFKCPLDPLTDRYPDPTDPTCVNYFLCHLGHAFPRRCDVRTAFHPELKECFPRYQVPEDLCALPVDCDYNGYIADPEDCTKYYICFFRQAIHYSCLTNHYFDEKKSLCINDKKKSNACKPIIVQAPSPKKPVFQRTRYVRPAPKIDTNPEPNNPTLAPVKDYQDTLQGDEEMTKQVDMVDVEDERTEQFPKTKRSTDIILNTTDVYFEPAHNETIITTSGS